MFQVGLPLQLRHRELHGDLPLLFSNLEHLHELDEENYNEKHSARMSEILLWIATKHPEVLQGEAKFLSDISITNLCFRDTYEKLDNTIPNETLTTLLNSKICKKVSKFCGYISSQVLNMDCIQNVAYLRLALGRQNMDLFSQQPSFTFRTQEILIHLLCRELNQEDLEALPIMPVYDDKTIYISDVGDQDVDWVIKAAVALNRQRWDNEQDCLIKLKRSKLTSTGFEAIAKGLSELELLDSSHDENCSVSWSLGVSSPHIGQCVVEIPGYEESRELYFDRISDMYDMQCFSFTDKEYEEEFLFERLEIAY